MITRLDVHDLLREKIQGGRTMLIVLKKLNEIIDWINDHDDKNKEVLTASKM
jgi:hypothetical protein